MIDITEQEFRVQLITTLKKEKVDEALPLLEGRQVDAVWCDKAVAIYVQSDLNKKARDIIEWAQKNTDVITWHNCILEYANAALKSYLKKRGAKAILFGLAREEDRGMLSEIIEVLSPIVDHIKADRRVSNPLELKALLQTINATIVLGQSEPLRELGNLLKEYRPIPLEYARLALSRLLPADPDIAKRIYDEHKGDFEANLLALVAEADICNNAAAAFTKGKDLKANAVSDEQKMSLAGTLFQIAQMISIEAMEESHALAVELLPHDKTLISVIAAAIQVRRGNVPQAKQMLEKTKDEDDAQWLQVYSFCLLTEGNFPEGIRYLSKVIEKMPSIEMYRILGEAAFQGGFIEKAILAFETVLDGNSDDIGARTKLAQLYLKANDDIGAESHLGELWGKDKNNVSFGMNYAACLARQGKTDDALEVYKSLSEMKKPPVEAVIAIAQLYKVKHQPQKGHQFLKDRRDKFWETPSFLMTYIDLAYASGNEIDANEAFIQVRKLQNERKAPQEILQEKTIDDLLEHHKGWQKRTELICQNILQGKMPWLMAGNLLNQAVYMGWAIRTQPLNYIGDDLESRAKLSVYSTNGFHAKKVDGQRRLEPLALPKKDAEIVIDLSSLITLHQLNLIETAMEYFGKIYVSSRYSAQLFEEAGRLEFHQISQIRSAKGIKEEIDKENIIILRSSDSSNYAYVNEYSLDEDPRYYYRLKDVQKVLSLTKDQKSRFQRVCCKPSGVDEKHPALKCGSNIIIEYHTLKTLVNIGALEAMKSSFRLHITPEDKQTLDSELNTISWQEDVQRWNDDLREKINKQFETLAPNYNKEEQEEICLDSYFIAKSKNLSIMTDDRVVQVLALNDEKFLGGVFGIDCLLKAFEQKKHLQEKEIADAFMQLMKWRYRFILPTIGMLLHLAKRYESSKPGEVMINVAKYAHDCMRDVGLFSGLEKTDPPIPMCARLYHAWLDVSMNFIIALWKDEEIVSETAIAFTRWTVKELMPSPPKVMLPRGFGMINIASDLVFEKAMFELACLTDHARAKEAVSELSQSLDLSDERFHKVFTDLIEMTGRTNVQAKG